MNAETAKKFSEMEGPDVWLELMEDDDGLRTYLLWCPPNETTQLWSDDEGMLGYIFGCKADDVEQLLNEHIGVKR